MKLKLDLHPIFSDSRSIEQALQQIIDDAVEKRASEVEIIPGKGSGALKKSVLRFLERPEVKARYHRIDKDSDNWGRLFVYFRHERTDALQKPESRAEKRPAVPCACCAVPITAPFDADEIGASAMVECASCGSPNRVFMRRALRGATKLSAELDYS